MCVHQVVADAAGNTVVHMRELSCLACSGECPHYGCEQYSGQLKKKLTVDEVNGTSSNDGDDLNVTIKARNTNIDLNSIVSGTVLRIIIQKRKESFQYYDVAEDIVREEDVRVEYLVRNMKFVKEIQTVDHECSVSDIIDTVVNPTIIKKGKIHFFRLG
ncbi:hypothetical protein PR048_020031, partial [Dryococelus australis]